MVGHDLNLTPKFLFGDVLDVAYTYYENSTLIVKNLFL